MLYLKHTESNKETVMSSVEYKAFAKINLHLDVTGIREDGFHSVNTVMQTISLCDTVSASLREDSEFILTCTDPDVPTDSKNLAIKAALLFAETTGIRRGADIHIEKRIPLSAGLAGGSADGAATLLALNELNGSPLSLAELCRLGSRLGADVPFCIVGGGAFADGKGDRLHSFPALPDCTLLVACGGEGVSTPAAYGMLDELYNKFESEIYYVPKDISPLRDAMSDGDLRRISNNLYNIFESPILAARPVASNLRRIMLDCGALGAMMSGSGPSVFGIFTDREGLERACDRIRKLGVTPHVCSPISRRQM